MKKKCLVITILSFFLFLCGCSSNSPMDIIETSEKSNIPPITKMHFENDDLFWSYAEENYEYVEFQDIHDGKLNNMDIFISDAIIISAKSENATTLKYIVGYKMNDGSYQCYDERITPSFCKLMTDKNLITDLQSGDCIRICASVQHQTSIDFNSVYGIKKTGHDDNLINEILNISNNPLINLQIQTANVLNGAKDTIIGERAFSSMDKQDIDKITLDQYSEFVETKVKDSGYNWYSIFFEDGTGIQWNGSDPGNATYGKIDSDGCIVDSEGYIQIRNGQYSYIPATQ